MTNRRNTIQKDLVKNAVYEMKGMLQQMTFFFYRIKNAQIVGR